MTRLTTIVFDLDGTLIDSAPDIRVAMNVALAALARPPLDLPTIVSFIGNGVEVLVERSLKATGGCDPALKETALARFRAAYAEGSTTLTRPYPGVEARIGGLRDKGVRLGICTNKPEGPAREICRQLDLDHYFSVIHGARDGQPKKPDPTPLRDCIAALGGAPDRAFYVGDSVVDYETARAAGIRFALFTGGYLNGALDGPGPDVSFDDWSADWLARL